MWWPVVFWLLLIPLLIVETIIFLKTRKLFWLIYALSIFTYVVAVSYTLDVFDAGRNAVILTLIASAIFMALIGRQLGRKVKKSKRIARTTWVAAIVIGAVIIVFFAVSVFFGALKETIRPVASIEQSTLLQPGKEIPRVDVSGGIVLFTRTYENMFFLPVPIPSDARYRGCVESNLGQYDLNVNEYQEAYPEVAPYATRTSDVLFYPLSIPEEQLASFEATQVSVYIMDNKQGWVPCSQITDTPLVTIPVV